MACSKLFARYGLLAGGRGGTGSSNSHHNKNAITWRNQHQSFHHHHPSTKTGNKILSAPANLFRKCKDTMLLVEATNGRVARVAMGLGQAGGAAALVFGTGYMATLLTTGHEHRLPNTAAERRAMMRIDVDDDDQHLVDADTISRYLEDRKNLSDRRMHLTYFHMFSALLAATATSILSFRVFKNKAFLVQLGNRPLIAVSVGVITPFLMGSLVRNLPRTQNTDGKLVPFGIKELGHLMYAGTLGLIAAPLYLLGGRSMTRAAFVTAGCMAGLHGVGKYIPKDALLNLEMPLVVAINAVLVAFLLTLVIRQNHYAFMPLYRFMMHGGLLIYSVNYLHGLQKMEQSSKSRFYDPVNAAMNLSMNLLNIFGRLAFMLPPYYQVCRDQMIVVPATQRSSSLPSKTSHKPGNSSEEGGEGGSGNGKEM